MHHLQLPLVDGLRSQQGGGSAVYRAVVAGRLDEGQILLELAAAVGIGPIGDGDEQQLRAHPLAPYLERACSVSGPRQGGWPCKTKGPAAAGVQGGQQRQPPWPPSRGWLVGQAQAGGAANLQPWTFPWGSRHPLNTWHQQWRQQRTKNRALSAMAAARPTAVALQRKQRRQAPPRRPRRPSRPRSCFLSSSGTTRWIM